MKWRLRLRRARSTEPSCRGFCGASMPSGTSETRPGQIIAGARDEHGRFLDSARSFAEGRAMSRGHEIPGDAADDAVRSS